MIGAPPALSFLPELTMPRVRVVLWVTLAALLVALPLRGTAQAPVEQLVNFSNGSVQLQGWLWKPNGNGPFPAVICNHGSEQLPGSLPDVAPTFLNAGYVFFVPHRRGHGRSASAGPYIVDQLDAAPAGTARNQLLVDLHYVHLTDQLAAANYLAAQPFVDPARIANMGFSFGGIQTIYAIGNLVTAATTSIQGFTRVVPVSAEARAGAGRYKVAVDCSGAAQSWVGALELQSVLRAQVAQTVVPVFFIQAQNDYSLLPNSVLSADMTALGKTNQTKVYPAVGTTAQEGHEFCVKGAATWGPDVVAYINDHIAGAATVDVTEYYNASLDHYFITWIAGEKAALDAGNTPTRWTRTGSSFKAYATAQPGTSPVCRYYIPPDKGDSHFFGRGTSECNATGAANPTFVLEDPQFMQLLLPQLGVCPAGTITIYRVFSNRADANHRYMTDRAIRDQMVARGWLAEGDGADLVVMCGAS